jgi:hypothetical protein
MVFVAIPGVVCGENKIQNISIYHAVLLVHEQRFEPATTRYTHVEYVRESHCNSDNLPVLFSIPVL